MIMIYFLSSLLLPAVEYVHSKSRPKIRQISLDINLKDATVSFKLF